MPIAALPANTIRSIGSSQTLTDSASLVKELVDNAIDGRATAISIEISTNTLDEIRVKDNGHGVAQEDRSRLCTRHCTSKIRNLEELRVIGGRSLGFRGEALASAAEMSGCLTISTRIEGEETASELRFDRQGHIESEKRTSLPVGTTVRVEKFLNALPVRKQAAEKTSVKVLAKTKRLLQAYSLARPHLRFSLKVLKAKNDNGNWKYPKTVVMGAPKLKASILTAATDIMGKKVIDQCQWTSATWSSDGEQMESASEALEVSPSQGVTYTFEAVLAKPKCEASLISNIGQFLSVDSRPVSCARGTLKKILALYKSHLNSLNPESQFTKIVDPFLCMNIICPIGSYDANVEPAKDDVLFENPGIVLRVAERYFTSIYGECQPTIPRIEARESLSNVSGVELLLARRPPANQNASKDTLPPARSTYRAILPYEKPTPQKHAPSRSLTPQDSITSDEAHTVRPNDTGLGPLAQPVTESVDFRDALAKESHATSPMQGSPSGPSSSEISPGLLPKNATWKSSMYGVDEDSMAELDKALGQQATPSMGEDIDGDTLRNVEVSNPWVLAKLNAAYRPLQHSHSTTARNEQLPTPARQSCDVDLSQGSACATMEPVIRRRSPQDIPETSGSSSPTPFPFPLKARGKRQGGDAVAKTRASNKDRYGNGALDTWVQRSLKNNLEPPGEDAEDDIMNSNMDPNSTQHRRDFVSAGSLLMGTPLDEIPEVFERPRRKIGPGKQQKSALQKSLISPVNDPNRVWFDTGEQPRMMRDPQGRPREEHQNTPIAQTLFLRNSKDQEAMVSTPGEINAVAMHPDLALTMDYEARKQKAIDQRREALRQQAIAQKREARTLQDAHSAKTPTNSPHKNRQAKAKAALRTNDDHATVVDPFAFEAGDPRAYLLRTQHFVQEPGTQSSKSKRRKTTMLPLETIREDHYIGDLVLQLKTDNPDIENQVLTSGTSCDEYISKGEEADAFSAATVQQVRGWEERLKAMVKGMYRIEGMAPEEEMDGELEIDLMSILKAHAATTADLTVS